MSQSACLTLLLIDDCAVDRYTYRRYLQDDRLYTYEILEFETAKQAMTWCEQQTPDVILLGYLLPDNDGLEFLQQLRENLNNRQSAVIMLTGVGDETLAVSAMNNGDQDYLVKNHFNPKTLQRAIHRAVERIHLTQQLEKSQQQQLMAAIALRIRQSLNLEEILHQTAKQVRQFLQADRVLVYQFQPDMIGCIVAESVIGGCLVTLGQQICDTYFQQGCEREYYQGKKRAIDDIYQADLTNCHLHLLEQFQIKAYLVVPILVKEQLWGLLVVHQCSASRHWQSVELDLLDQLAVQIAIAIQQASAYQQAQQELAQRQQVEVQLRQTNEQLANANVELTRTTRLKDEFLSNMSHELRTPFNAILGMSEGFLEGVFGSINERQVKAITTIERNGRHLLELINDILDLSKIESGKLELQLSDVSVKSLCEASLAFVKQMALKKNIRLNTHIAKNIHNIRVDERRLRQVLIKLLTNAVKFTSEGGSITLEVCLEEVGEVNSSSSPNLCFQITDTSIGIADEEISKLFQPFIQLDSSLNRQYNGTGLGLALVQRIVTLHGGTVSVSSEIGQGSCFSICIPSCTKASIQ